MTAQNLAPGALPSRAQAEFDSKYITSTEIMKSLGVSRTTMHHARNSGMLPDPICIPGLTHLWEREAVKPYLDAWRHTLTVRRNAGASSVGGVRKA